MTAARPGVDGGAITTLDVATGVDEAWLALRIPLGAVIAGEFRATSSFFTGAGAREGLGDATEPVTLFALSKGSKEMEAETGCVALNGLRRDVPFAAELLLLEPFVGGAGVTAGVTAGLALLAILSVSL